MVARRARGDQYDGGLLALGILLVLVLVLLADLAFLCLTAAEGV